MRKNPFFSKKNLFGITKQGGAWVWFFFKLFLHDKNKWSVTISSGISQRMSLITMLEVIIINIHKKPFFQNFFGILKVIYQIQGGAHELDFFFKLFLPCDK